MSKQLKNLVESAQPPAPNVATFIEFVKKVLVGSTAVECPENRLFGQTFAPTVAQMQPKKHKNMEIAARMAMEYEDVQAKAGLQGTIVDLDDWLCGLAKFVLVPDVLLEDLAGQKQMRMDRITLCAGVCSAEFKTGLRPDSMK